MTTVINLIVGNLCALLVSVVGLVFTVVISILIKIAQYNNFVNSPPVDLGWGIVRDLCNMFFVVILLVIAFGTVLKIETYHYKRLLPKLLLMALLINFSKTIAGLFIDISQVIMLTFVAGFAVTGAANFVNLLGIEKLMTISGYNEVTSNAALAGSYVLALIMAIIALIVVTIITIILFLRIVALWILVILSPFAYLFSIIPTTQKYAQQWWAQFTKYVIVGPVLSFFIWLSLSMSSSIGSGEFKILSGSDIYKSGVGSQEQQNLKASITEISTESSMAQYMIAICLLVGSLMAAQQIGVAGSKMAGDWAGKIQRGGWETAKFAGRRADLAKMWAGAKLQERGKDREGIGGKVLRGMGKTLGVSYRPTVWKKAWQGRAEKLERSRYAKSTGTAQNFLNRVIPFSKDKFNYERIRTGQAEAEEMKILKAGGYSTELMKQTAFDALKNNDHILFANAIKFMAENADTNELLTDKKGRVREALSKKTAIELERFGITDINSGLGENVSTLQALTYYGMGSEDEGARIASDVGFIEHKNGNFQYTVAGEIDKDRKYKYLPLKEQAKIALSFQNLMHVGEKAKRMKPGTIFDKNTVFDKQGRRTGMFKDISGKYGKGEGAEIDVVFNKEDKWQIVDEKVEDKYKNQILKEEEQDEAEAIFNFKVSDQGREVLKGLDSEFIDKLSTAKPQLIQVLYKNIGLFKKELESDEYSSEQKGRLKEFIKEIGSVYGVEAEAPVINFANIKNQAKESLGTLVGSADKIEKTTKEKEVRSLLIELQEGLKKIETTIIPNLATGEQKVLQDIIKNMEPNIRDCQKEYSQDLRSIILSNAKELISIFEKSIGEKGEETKREEKKEETLVKPSSSMESKEPLFKKTY